MPEDARRKFGNEGEGIAADFLEKKGMKIEERQKKTNFGEIDLVCIDQGEIVFVEVKTRKTETFGYPEDSITKTKFAHMLRSAKAYLLEKHITDKPWRIDVVAIQIKNGKSEILHFKAIDIPF